MLIDAAEDLGPVLFAKLGMERALNREVEDVINPDPKSRHSTLGRPASEAIGRESRNAAHPRPTLGAADWLGLAAAPTFAIMALLTGFLGGGKMAMICGTAGLGCVDDASFNRNHPRANRAGNAKYRPIEPARLRVNLSGGCSRI
jgi:hypothetical protein